MPGMWSVTVVVAVVLLLAAYLVWTGHRVERVHENRSTIGGFLGRRTATGDHWCALHHGLQDRQAVALSLARIAEHLRSRVQPAEVVGRHEPDEPRVATRRDVDITPTLGTGNDERKGIVEQGDGLDESAKVLARLDRSDEQQVPLGKAVQRRDTGHLVGADLRRVDTEWNEAEPVGGDVGRDAIVHRRLAAAQHEVGATTDLIEAATEDAVAALREL